MRAAIEAAGARRLDLPPCSPEPIEGPRSAFTPTEMAFAKLKALLLKALLRKVAERAVEGLWSAIGRLVEAFRSNERANHFTAAGDEPD